MAQTIVSCSISRQQYDKMKEKALSASGLLQLAIDKLDLDPLSVEECAKCKDYANKIQKLIRFIQDEKLQDQYFKWKMGYHDVLD